MKYIFFFLALLLFGSCAERKCICNTYTSIPIEGWDTNDTLFMHIDTIMQSADYEFEVGVRSTRLYPYQYLWLLAKVQLFCPDTLLLDTICCKVADINGNFLGNGLSVFDNSNLVTTLHLYKGQYGTISLRHIMRRSQLPGLTDIGVIICTNK